MPIKHTPKSEKISFGKESISTEINILRIAMYANNTIFINSYIKHPHKTSSQTICYNSLDLTALFTAMSLKRNSYVLTCMWLLTNSLYLTKQQKLIQAYLQHIYATFGGSLTVITNSAEESKMTWSKRSHKNWALNTSSPVCTNFQQTESWKDSIRS